MQFVADFHLHSKYSRAVSQNMTLPIMAEFAQKKGIDILSASDWTHPLWIREIQSQLEETVEGLYKLKNPHFALRASRGEQKSRVEDAGEPMFILSTEISSIYTQGGKLRRIHNLIFAPNIETAQKISKELIRRGCNLHSDGRPIIGISSKNLLEIISAINTKTMLIPCHIWTPHFGIYGSASGFDSLEEAFGDLSRYIYGIETGLSSDPVMNWRIEELDNRSILSFSDAHSPAKMGREATVFVDQRSNIKDQNQPGLDQNNNPEFKIAYADIVSAIKREKSANLRIAYTIEFYPEEGKYHFSGHRNCKVVYGPEDLKSKGNICPVCKRKLTDGVLNRVLELSERTEEEISVSKMSSNKVKWYIDTTKNHPPFVKLVPLLEIIAEVMHSTVFSKRVIDTYDTLCCALGSELNVLLLSDIKEIERHSSLQIAEAVGRVRGGNITIEPGFDGEYGKVKITNSMGIGKVKEPNNQRTQNQLGLGL